MSRTCDICGKALNLLPFVCRLCGGNFCAEHRIPESHNCKELGKLKEKKKDAIDPIFDAQLDVKDTPTEKVIKQKSNLSFDILRAFYPKEYFELTVEGPSDIKEVKHLSLGLLMIFLVTLSYFLPLIILNLNNPFNEIVFITSSILISTIAFIGHQLAQKISAYKQQVETRFYILRLPAILTIASIFLPLNFIAPGGTMIIDENNLFKNAKIRMSGTLYNFAISCLCLILWINTSAFNPLLSSILQISMNINLGFGLANILPIGIFNGNIIYRWDRKVWFALLVCYLAIYLTSIFVIFTPFFIS
ncbi:MAG: AN1-type zinc finger domain-containing protein [Candidatus Ranarchaeia archaeon]